MMGGWINFSDHNGGRGCSIYEMGDMREMDGFHLTMGGQKYSAHYGNLAQVYSEPCQTTTWSFLQKQLMAKSRKQFSQKAPS